LFKTFSCIQASSKKKDKIIINDFNYDNDEHMFIEDQTQQINSKDLKLRLKSLTNEKAVQDDLRDKTIKIKQVLNLKAKGMFIENVTSNILKRAQSSPISKLKA
jgi:hypothetical protein